jgi:hypothetical protein
VRTFALLALGLAIGAAVVWIALSGGGDGSPAPVEGTSSESAIQRLSDELERERAERAALERHVADLEAMFAEEVAMGDLAAATEVGRAGEPGEEIATAASGKKPDWFDRDGLLAAGLPETDVDWIHELFERYVSARLEYEDARLRKGERSGLHAIRDELALEKQFRTEFGDEDFDAVRFAMNEQNRVILTDLLEGAAGFRAGIRPGDEVISYDGERVFRPRDLKLLIAAGERNELVEMRVLRDGEVVRVFLPRGPIGAQLAFEVRPPIR